MKKLLSVLLVSLLLIGCSEDRVLLDELTNKGSEKSELMYYESGLFNGIGYDVYSNGKLKSEVNYKDGKRDGLCKGWYVNDQLSNEMNFNNGTIDGLYREWYENGQLKFYGQYKDGEEDGIWKYYDKNGKLDERNYKDGEEIK